MGRITCLISVIYFRVGSGIILLGIFFFASDKIPPQEAASECKYSNFFSTGL